MANFKRSGKIVSLISAVAILLTAVSAMLPVSKLVSSAESPQSTEMTDNFDTIDKNWSFGNGIVSKEIVADAFEGDSALRISGEEGDSGDDFVRNAILNSSYNVDEKNVSQIVEFRRNDETITRWGIGLLAASTESDPVKLAESGSAYGAIMCLADSGNDSNHYKSWLAIFKVKNGKAEYLAFTTAAQEWTMPQWKQRLQLDLTNEGGIIQLDARLFLYDEDNGTWVKDATHGVSVVDYDNPLVEAGYQGIVYRRYPDRPTTGTGKVDIFNYYKKGMVPDVSEGSFSVTGKPSRMLFERPATSEAIQEQSSMTMQFDSGLAGKDLAISFMIRDVTDDGSLPREGHPGWTDQCGGYQDFYFTNYNTPEGKIVDPDNKDCDLYTFYIKGTDDLKFKIGMFGYTRKIYVTDIKLVETDANHNPINGANLADEYGDLSDWSFFKYEAGKSGHVEFINTTATAGKLFDIPDGFFTTYPEPLEKEQMIYHTGNSGAAPHLIQYVRVPYVPGKAYEFTGKLKAWNSSSYAVRVEIQWRSGGINVAECNGSDTKLETNNVTGDFKLTFKMPESYVSNKGTAQEEIKSVPLLDDGRVLLSITYQAGTCISTFARPSFKEQGSDVELLRNADFKLGFNDWQFLPSTLGGVYRSGEILDETPDTYYSGPGTGGEAKLMAFDANMFWADTNEEYLPDEGEWWSKEMIKDEEELENKSNLATIEGIIHDAKGKPLSGATLFLSSDEQMIAKSDAKGYFRFENIAPDTYEISLLLDDGTTVLLEEYIFAEGNKIHTVNLTFAKSTNNNGNTVTDTDYTNTASEKNDSKKNTSLTLKNNNKPTNKKNDKTEDNSADSNIAIIIITVAVVLLAGATATGIIIYRRKKKHIG